MDHTTSGDRGSTTSGDRGPATSGDRGPATSGNRGPATSGNRGPATSGNRGPATSGNRGPATSGDRGSTTSGDRGSTTSSNRAREPRQERSRFTVEAIFEAAARLVDESGHQGATTGRIAHLAGVSVGSLYQYFPGKEALFSALTERTMETDVLRVRDAVDRARDMPLEPGIREVLEASLTFALGRPRLFCWMLRYLPGLGLLPAVERMERTLIHETRRFLEDHRDELGDLDLDLLAVAGVGAVRGAVVLLARERPAAIETAQWLDLTVSMVLGTIWAQQARAAATSHPPAKTATRADDAPGIRECGGDLGPER